MVTLTDTLRDTRRSDDLLRQLQDVPYLAPEHNWEGEFTGAKGSATGCSIRVKARLAFHCGMIEGVGRGLDFPAEMPAAAAEFSLSGFLDGDASSFQLWFGALELAGEPIVATGQLSKNGREMAGDWSIRCFSDPETCGCGGGGGDFRLKRID